MAIGTSLGAYFEDDFHHQAGINTDPSVDNNVIDPEVDPGGMQPKPKLDVMPISDKPDPSKGRIVVHGGDIEDRRDNNQVSEYLRGMGDEVGVAIDAPIKKVLGINDNPPVPPSDMSRALGSDDISKIPDVDTQLEDIKQQYLDKLSKPFVAQYSQHLIEGIKQLLKTPGDIAKPNPYPEGTEENAAYENSRNQAISDWSNSTAMSMIGLRSPVGKIGEPLPPSETPHSVSPEQAAESYAQLHATGQRSAAQSYSRLYEDRASSEQTSRFFDLVDEYHRANPEPTVNESVNSIMRIARGSPAFDEPALRDLHTRMSSTPESFEQQPLNNNDFESFDDMMARFDREDQARQDMFTKQAKDASWQDYGKVKVADRGFGSFLFKGEDGKVWPLSTSLRENGKTIYVNWVGDQSRQAVNSFSKTAMKGLFKALADKYPKAEYIAGYRISGARNATGKIGTAKMRIPGRGRSTPEPQLKSIDELQQLWDNPSSFTTSIDRANRPVTDQIDPFEGPLGGSRDFQRLPTGVYAPADLANYYGRDWDNMSATERQPYIDEYNSYFQ